MQNDFLKDNEVDLLEELKKSTQKVADFSNDFKNDFDIPEDDEEEAPEEVKETVNFDNDFDIPDTPEEIEEEEEAENLSNFLDPEDLAELILVSLDTIFEKSLPFVYLKSLSKQELLNLKRLEKKYKGIDKVKITELDEEDLDAMASLTDFEDYKKGLPFTPEEINRIKKPLIKVLGSANVEMTPQTALIFTVLSVMAVRLLPIGANFGSKLIE